MKYAFGAVLVMLLAACPSSAVTEAAQASAAAQGRANGAAVGWAGTYRGDLPCVFCGVRQVCGSPCGGVDTELLLRPDEGYRLTETYRLQPPVRREVSGRFEWLSEPGLIRLDEAGGGRLFRVEDGGVWSADPTGRFWGDPMFQLKKTD
ncbi:MAG: copper resistance protein NlpE N-terminal domain-containing protein [Eikenella sp.]|nr:copper resistance protein NlpE N-terminal domain-containing protein [Eikenella sp.]